MQMKKILLGLTLAAAATIASAQSVSTQSFSVSWSTVAGATKYQLETRIGTGQLVVDDVTSGTTKVVQKSIATGQVFTAKVRACDAVWCGDWSADANLTMPAKPATPNILGIQLIITPAP